MKKYCSLRQNRLLLIVLSFFALEVSAVSPAKKNCEISIFSCPLAPTINLAAEVAKGIKSKNACFAQAVYLRNTCKIATAVSATYYVNQMAIHFLVEPNTTQVASVVTNGKFCSGTTEVLFRCGVTASPGAGWVDVGGGCYHFNNGSPVACATPVTTGKFCSGANEIQWQCGLLRAPALKWVNVSPGCYHLDTGVSVNCPK